MSSRIICAVLGVVGAGLLAGCGSGPAAATVSGEVTVDGVPVEKGVISYVSADGSGKPATANIENGKYEIQTTAGNKLVQISAPVVTERRKESKASNAPMVDITKESLPDRFNSKTELTFEVKAGSNTKDWPLKKKP